MKFTFLLALLATLALPTTAAISQDAAAKQNVVKALETLSTADSFFTGSIVEEGPEKDDDIAGGVQRVVVSSIGGGGDGTSFTGEFELGVSKTSQLALVSKEEFPGLKVWISGEQTICVQAHADKPFSPMSIRSTMSPLVNWKSLSEAVEKATKLRVSSKNGETTVRVVLDKEVIPVQSLEKEIGKKLGGPGVAIQMVGGPSLQPEVVDLAATFVLDSKNELKSAEYAIQYSDPVKGLMAGAMKGGGVIRLGGNVKPTDSDPELGKLITISYEKLQKPSERVVDFIKQAQKMAK